MSRPILYLDIDGVLSPIVNTPEDWDGAILVDTPMFVPYRPEIVDGIRHLTSRASVRLLTDWEPDLLGPWQAVLGQVLIASQPDAEATDPRDSATWWKARIVTETLDTGANVIWIDDRAPGDLPDGHPGHLLVIRTDPTIGMTTDHLRQIEVWLSTYSGD